MPLSQTPPQALSTFLVPHAQPCFHPKLPHDHKKAAIASAKISRHNIQCVKNEKPFPKVHRGPLLMSHWLELCPTPKASPTSGRGNETDRLPETNPDFSPGLGMGHTFLSHMERHGTLNKIRVPTARKEIIAWASDGPDSNPDSATFPLSTSRDLGCLICKMTSSQDLTRRVVNVMSHARNAQHSTGLHHRGLAFSPLPRAGPRTQLSLHCCDCRRVFPGFSPN